MNLRLWVSLITGKLASKVTKKLGSGGTALPGLLTNSLDHNSLSELAGQIKNNSILITGTNGKTTTARALGNILKAGDISFVHNRAGSNLLRGITTSLIDKSSWFGKINVDHGVFEVDEFVMPLALEQIKTKVVVINNLFRDQLDRYGEIATVLNRWERSVSQLDKETFLILNADDPNIAYLGTITKAKVIYFGLEDENQASAQQPELIDAQKCPKCASFLKFKYFYASHMGDYKCPKCDFSRPKPHIFAKNIKLDGLEGSSFDLTMGENQRRIRLYLPGIYNIYNSLGSTGAGAALGIGFEQIVLGLEQSRPAFGRGEKLVVSGHEVYTLLIKNPTGFNEVLKLLKSANNHINLLIAINDLIADGKDVSWLWDVDVEKLGYKKLFLSGIRAKDMALRLKYAGLDSSKDNFVIEEDLRNALTLAISGLGKDDKLYILPTYTALIQLRKILHLEHGAIKFSED